MNQDNMKIWSVVSIKPNQMSKAEANLRNQNFTYLAPKIEISKRQQNRFISKTELLFPGYIFVLIDADGGDDRILRSTYGISNIIRVGSKIGEVPKAFIDALKASFTVKNSENTETLTPGQKVKIIRGPFTGFIAELVSIDSSTRVKCLFDIISREVISSVLIKNMSLID
jgi:transcriptional antiterminator RfaH